MYPEENKLTNNSASILLTNFSIKYWKILFNFIPWSSCYCNSCNSNSSNWNSTMQSEPCEIQVTNLFIKHWKMLFKFLYKAFINAVTQWNGNSSKWNSAKWNSESEIPRSEQDKGQVASEMELPRAPLFIWDWFHSNRRPRPQCQFQPESMFRPRIIKQNVLLLFRAPYMHIRIHTYTYIHPHTHIF